MIEDGTRVRIISHQYESNVGKEGFAYFGGMSTGERARSFDLDQRLVTDTPLYRVLPQRCRDNETWKHVILCYESEVEVIEE